MNTRAWAWAGAASAAIVVLADSPTWAQFGPAKVTVAPIVQREVAAGQTFVGTVVPLRTSVVGAPIGGRVEAFVVNEGDRVTKGQMLAKLRTKTIELELAVAKAEHEARRQELAELEAGARPEELEMARAKLASVQAMAQYHRAREARLKSLIGNRGATQEEVQEAAAAANQHESVLKEAKAALQMVTEGPRKEKIAHARAKAQAALDEANRIADQLAKHTIIAPFDGYVVAEHTEVGQWVTQGALVAEIIELDHVDVEFHVLEDFIGVVRKGMPVRLEIGALPQDALVGAVTLVVPKANLRARTFPVKVRLPNTITDAGPKLKAGMIARVTLQVGVKETALLVPKDALVLGGPSPAVYVAEGDGGGDKAKARLVPVVLGVADNGLIQVKGDLKPGMQVVVVGNERLRPGQDVEIARVASSQEK
jgi:RND family efflux transporter MFP subunit